MKSDNKENEDDYNVLTVENIKAYHQAEKKITEHEKFKTVCITNGKNDNNECR